MRPQGKIIGIIGTRRRDTSIAFQGIKKIFDSIYNDGDWICSGGCGKGADRYAEMLAKERGIPILIFYPDYKKYSKGAPMIRNVNIAINSDIIIACVMNPEDGIVKVLSRKDGGTEDTLRKFVKSKETEKGIYLV